MTICFPVPCFKDQIIRDITVFVLKFTLEVIRDILLHIVMSNLSSKFSSDVQDTILLKLRNVCELCVSNLYHRVEQQLAGYKGLILGRVGPKKVYQDDRSKYA